ncbi:MAG: hypothetical protein BMS9Abin08_1443 [Gammaproteobacteria bacterium]|nr:MAG: hypothetical protein BMS9Abin08_1443 [Gammaproteobacteria bacterium]
MPEHTFSFASSGYRFARPLRWILILLLLALGSACGSAPVQEMSEARQAIDAARAAGAEQYAAEQYNKAQALLKKAKQLLNDDHFSKARRSAAEARDEAVRARETAQQAGSQ